MGSVTFEDFLQPEHLSEVVKDLIETFRAKNPQFANSKVPLPQLLEQWEAQNGPLIPYKPSFTYIDHGYLIPIDGDASDNFLELARPEGLDTLTPMIPNPYLCPRAALPFIADIPSLKEMIKEVTKQSSNPTSETSLFSIDTAGTESIQINDELKKTLSKRHGLLRGQLGEDDSGSEGEQLAPSAVTDDLVSKQDFKSAKEFLHNQAGRPLEGTANVVPKTVILGYQDIQTSHKNVFSKPDKSISTAGTEISLIRELVEDNSLEPKNKSDRVRSKQNRKEANENIKDGWFGMRRRTITPEDRAELKAIDLRGYVDGINTYRGGKRRFELSEAESGFFQYGIVKDAGLNKAIGEHTLVVAAPDKKKKSKSLVKSLMVK